MKPYGMTAAFQIVRPTAAENAIWDAARDAHREGWSVDRFRQECHEAWGETLREQADEDAKGW
jgi:hypothetical protein